LRQYLSHLSQVIIIDSPSRCRTLQFRE